MTARGEMVKAAHPNPETAHMTSVGRDQEVPALSPPARQDAGRRARGPGRPGRAGGGGPVLLLLAAVAGGAAVLGRLVERAAGLGHAAREPAAAQLVGVGRVLLHHRTAAVHADRGADRAGSLGGARRRGHDLHAARPARRVPRQGPQPGRRRVGPRPAGRGPDAVAAARCHLDPAALAGPHRDRGTPAGHLAADRPRQAAVVRTRAGGPAVHRDHGGRLDHPAHRHRPAGARRRRACPRRADQARETAHVQRGTS